MDLELKSHILNLYHLALSDHEFDKTESDKLYEIGSKWEVSREEINQVILHPFETTFEIPRDSMRRLAFIKDYVEMIMADGIIKENENARFRELLEKFGFSTKFNFGEEKTIEPEEKDEIVEVKTRDEVHLIPIIVEKKKKIYLEKPGANEIPLTPLHKSVYVFYLMHPEGVRLKELSNFKAELRNIYRNISVTDDEDKVNNSINSLTNAFGNSFNEKKARINKLLNDLLGSETATFYRISGKAGQQYKVNLPPDYIHFID